MLYRHHGARRATVVVKATFALVQDCPAALVEPVPLVRDELRFEDNPMRSVRASERSGPPTVPLVDVTLIGHAGAPEGRPAQAVAVRLSLHRGAPLLDRTVHVFGDCSVAEPLRVTPFERLPLRYERAYGGLSFEANPIGRGAGREAVALPNLVLDPRDPRSVAGFGPISRYAVARRRLLGDAERARWRPGSRAPRALRLGLLPGPRPRINGSRSSTATSGSSSTGCTRACRACSRSSPGSARRRAPMEPAARARSSSSPTPWPSTPMRSAARSPGGARCPSRRAEASLAGLHVVAALVRPGTAVVWPDASELVQPLPGAPVAIAAPGKTLLARTVDDWSARAASAPQAAPPPLPAPPPVPVPAPAPAIVVAPMPAIAPAPASIVDVQAPDRPRPSSRRGARPHALEAPGPLVRRFRAARTACASRGATARSGTSPSNRAWCTASAASPAKARSATIPVVPEVASRFAARLRHDGVRFRIERRPECSVPLTLFSAPAPSSAARPRRWCTGCRL